MAIFHQLEAVSGQIAKETTAAVVGDYTDLDEISVYPDCVPRLLLGGETGAQQPNCCRDP
jgi:hypothetical protein